MKGVGSPLSWPAVLTVSHSNKFYSPLILPQVWKFFFIPLTHKDSVQLLGCVCMFFFFFFSSQQHAYSMWSWQGSRKHWHEYVQFTCSVVSNSLRPHGLQHTRLPCPSTTPRAYSDSSTWVGNAIQPSHTLSFPSTHSFKFSQHQGLFQWVSSLHQLAKILKFQLQHCPSNEYSGLISFRIDWLDLLAV